MKDEYSIARVKRQREYDQWRADQIKRDVVANPKAFLETVEQIKTDIRKQFDAPRNTRR